jgi:hypothetical protein
MQVKEQLHCLLVLIAFCAAFVLLGANWWRGDELNASFDDDRDISFVPPGARNNSQSSVPISCFVT